MIMPHQRRGRGELGAGLLAAISFQPASHPAQAAPATAPALDPPPPETIQVTYIVTTILFSNAPPGHLIDYLHARLGNEASFFDALTYLKERSNGTISQAFYDQVDTAPGAEEVKLTLLRDYRSPGFEGTVEIGADGTVHTRAQVPSPGYTITLCLGESCMISHTENLADAIHTGTTSYAGMEFEYHAFMIAWRRISIYLPLTLK